MKPRVVVLDEASSMLRPARPRRSLPRRESDAGGGHHRHLHHAFHGGGGAGRPRRRHARGRRRPRRRPARRARLRKRPRSARPRAARCRANRRRPARRGTPPAALPHLDELEGALVAAARENDAASDLRAHVRDEGDPRRVEEGSAERAQSEEKAAGAHAGASPPPVENDVEDAVITFDHVGFSLRRRRPKGPRQGAPEASSGARGRRRARGIRARQVPSRFKRCELLA